MLPKHWTLGLCLLSLSLLYTPFFKSWNWSNDTPVSIPSANTTAPNFIFILVDDMGWNGTESLMKTSVTGSQSDFYETPNINTLVAQGMTFSQAYAPASKCSPSRNSILTGQTTARNQFTETGNPAVTGELLIPPLTVTNIDIADQTIAEWLRATGCDYQTAHYGKWHLKSGGTIAAHGFLDGDGNTSNSDGNAGDSMVPQSDPKKIFSTTTKGLDFIDLAHGMSKPFYLQLSYYAVHTLIEAQPTSIAYYTGKSPGTLHDNVNYAAMTQDLDEGIGQIMQRVIDLGIDNNTYIIFMSDNGGANAISSNGILRRGKGYLYEGGIRVPMVIKGPGIDAGVQSDEPVVGYDLFPTIAELNQSLNPLPSDLDGQSITALFSASTSASFMRTQPLFFHSPHYATPNKTPRSAAIEGNYKLVVDYENCEHALYNLDTNIQERDTTGMTLTNLYTTTPTIAMPLLIKLRDHLKAVNANMPSLDPASFTGGTATDVDNDGLDDIWEFQELLCPGHTATDDVDGDGFDNLTEMNEGLDPLTPSTILNIRVFLQGAYNGADMNTDLETASIIPLTDPYGLGATVTSIPPDVVDWVKVELRDTATPSTVLLEVPAFLRKDGTLLDMDAKLGLRFENVGFSTAKVVVQHRNHLGVMANDTVNFN